MPPSQPSILHGPSAPIPVSLPFGDLLARHARERGSHPAVISHHQNVTLTYQKLHERSDMLASAFLANGVGKGDKVAIMLGSRTEYLEVCINNINLSTHSLSNRLSSHVPKSVLPWCC
jgi:non-ribosomal peptide synthetase component E (peptide arylation enzyme)